MQIFQINSWKWVCCRAICPHRYDLDKTGSEIDLIRKLGLKVKSFSERQIQIEIDNKNTLIGAHRQAIRVVLQRAAVGGVGKLAVVVADRVEQFGAARS